MGDIHREQLGVLRGCVTMGQHHHCDGRRNVPPRFLQIADVAETLNISARQAYGLVTSGELPAIKIGKSWRVEVAELETYIERAYADTRSRVESGTLEVD